MTSKLVYVARGRKINSCEAPPADALALESSRLTLDAVAPSSRKEEEKEMVGSLGLHLFLNPIPTERRYAINRRHEIYESNSDVYIKHVSQNAIQPLGTF